MSGSFLLNFYQYATALAAPVMPAWLQWRVGRGKEAPMRWRERFGETTVPRSDGRLIWCHAASVGETTSVLPLIAALHARGFSILLTTGTVTSAHLGRATRSQRRYSSIRTPRPHSLDSTFPRPLAARSGTACRLRNLAQHAHGIALAKHSNHSNQCAHVCQSL